VADHLSLGVGCDNPFPPGRADAVPGASLRGPLV
jgi:hypothetical protein